MEKQRHAFGLQLQRKRCYVYYGREITVPLSPSKNAEKMSIILAVDGNRLAGSTRVVGLPLFEFVLKNFLMGGFFSLTSCSLLAVIVEIVTNNTGAIKYLWQTICFLLVNK